MVGENHRSSCLSAFVALRFSVSRQSLSRILLNQA